MLEKEILELKDKLKEIKENIKELLRETPPEIDNNDQIQTLRNELEHCKEKLNIKVFLSPDFYHFKKTLKKPISYSSIEF